jgi:hypothetical protein
MTALKYPLKMDHERKVSCQSKGLVFVKKDLGQTNEQQLHFNE